MTPERLAALEAANADGANDGEARPARKPAMGIGAGYKRVRLDEERSPPRAAASHALSLPRRIGR